MGSPRINIRKGMPTVITTLGLVLAGLLFAWKLSVPSLLAAMLLGVIIGLAQIIVQHWQQPKEPVQWYGVQAGYVDSKEEASFHFCLLTEDLADAIAKASTTLPGLGRVIMRPDLPDERILAQWVDRDKGTIVEVLRLEPGVWSTPL